MHRPGPRNYARHVAQALLAAVAIGIFAAHASVYGAWLIDDAGISIADLRLLEKSGGKSGAWRAP